MISPSKSERQGASLVACAHILARYIRRRVRSDEEAAEVFQELSLLVLRTPHSHGNDDCFIAWCKGLARNTLAHHYRAKHRRAALLHRAEPEAASLLGSVAGDPERQAQTKEQLERLFARVDEKATRLLLERYLLGESAEEIARRLVQSSATVRMRLMRVRTAMQRSEPSPGSPHRSAINS